MALRDVFRHLSTDRIYEKCALAVEFVRAMLATDAPARRERVAVAALNPHGGESGLFGDEEQTIIAPAVLRAQSQGWNVVGPLPADTLIYRAVNGEFDAVVAMYHDQGHIPLKLIGFESAVNVTLGLPIVRTSVAHGTAFDIAWQGGANASSMVAATRTAARLCAARRSAVSDA
jgi:4-hydroxythreonine-4-phosphate dehydrogenase